MQTPDVFAVLESFLQMCVCHLSEGRPIDMGQLGSFSPAISSRGEELAADVDRQLNINFRPSGLLKERLSTVKFEKVSNGSPRETPAESSES